MSEAQGSTKPDSHFRVGVVVARRKLKGPWADAAWSPHAVLPTAPEVAPWTSLGRADDDELFYAGPVDVELHPASTAHYRDNLTAARPSVWVSLRQVGVEEVEVAAVTVDPYEGEALAEGMSEIVEAVPMPPEIAERLSAYFAAFHVERQFFKRRRDRADPDALGRRSRVERDGEDE
jgi:hypothetical protein